MQMPLRASLLRLAFIVTAIGLLLHAINFDDEAFPIALLMVFATLIYEAAYQTAIGLQNGGQIEGRTASI